MSKYLTLVQFNDSPKGYPGDEDNGTMAAWYIFSSLGFYPVTAASNQYVLGIPLWDKARINLSSGQQLTILQNQMLRNKFSSTKSHLLTKKSMILSSSTKN